MFQHTSLTELGGQRSHRGLAKLPVSISGTEVTISLLRTIHAPKVMGVGERPQPMHAHFLSQRHLPSSVACTGDSVSPHTGRRQAVNELQCLKRNPTRSYIPVRTRPSIFLPCW